MNIRDQIFNDISSFPTLPAITQRLLGVIEDPEANYGEIGKLIQYDPALTANILKAANSAFLGFSKPVCSIAEAGIRIGKKWIFQMAISSLIYSNLNVYADGYDMSAKELWRHSIAVALMSENLCKTLNTRDPGMIFTGGLLHDIGKIALQENVGEYFEQLQKLVDKEKLSFEEAENKLLGIDHSEVGAMIAEHWQFSPQIIDIIRWHHNPDGAPDAALAIDIVHAADAVCMMQGLGLGRDGLQYHCCPGAMNRLNLTTTQVERAVGQLLVSIEDIEQMFSEHSTECAVGGKY